MNITIAVIYLPNDDDPNFFKQVADIIKERHEHKILIGDFNLALNVELDRCNINHNNNEKQSGSRMRVYEWNYRPP